MTVSKSNGSFLKNTLTLTSGNIGAQAIKIALVPVVTRLFPPESFGIFSTITAIIMVISSVSHFRYNVAIQLPNKDADADSLALLCISLVFLTSATALIPILIFRDQIAPFLKIKDSTYILLFIPCGIMLRGTVMIFNQWHLRYKSFAGMSKALVFGAVCDRIITLFFGFLGSTGPIGLLSGRYAGVFLTNIYLFFHRGTRKLISIFKNANLDLVKTNAVHFKKFPLYSWSEFLLEATNHLPVILLAFFFNQQIVGYFALTRRVLSEPLLLFGNALSRSFFQKTSELYRENKDVRGFTLRTLHFHCFALIFPMLFVGIFAQDLFKIIFGAQWVHAGLFTQLLIPLFIIDTLLRPMMGLFDILVKQRERMLFNIALFVSTITFFSLGGVSEKPWLSLLGYSVFNTFIILLILFWISKQINISHIKIVKIIGSYTLKAGFLITILLAIKLLTNNVYFNLFTGLVAWVAYLLYYRFIDGYMSKELLTLLKK